MNKTHFLIFLNTSMLVLLVLNGLLLRKTFKTLKSCKELLKDSKHLNDMSQDLVNGIDSEGEEWKRQ